MITAFQYNWFSLQSYLFYSFTNILEGSPQAYQTAKGDPWHKKLRTLLWGMCRSPGKSRPAWSTLDSIAQWTFICLMILYLYQKIWQSSLPPNAPALKKLYYLMFCHGFSLKDLRSSSEESHIVKIEKPNEKGRRRESGAAPQGSLGQGGISLFQAVGYLTGEMKECRNWLKGRPMPRAEAARPGQRASPPSGLDWGSCSHTHQWQGPHIWGPQAQGWLWVAVMYPTTWIPMVSEFSAFHWF